MRASTASSPRRRFDVSSEVSDDDPTPDAAPPRAEQGLPQGVWEQLAGPLSSALVGLGSLRSRQARGSPDARELDLLLVDLDRMFGALVRVPCPSVAVDRVALPAGVDSGDTAVAADEADEVFERWVQRRCPEPLTDGGRYAPEPPERLLERLSTVDRPMPPATSLELGLGRSSTYARAARLLLWARHAPDGPRCRSLRSAYYFLADAQPDALPATWRGVHR